MILFITFSTQYYFFWWLINICIIWWNVSSTTWRHATSSSSWWRWCWILNSRRIKDSRLPYYYFNSCYFQHKKWNTVIAVHFFPPKIQSKKSFAADGRNCFTSHHHSSWLYAQRHHHHVILSDKKNFLSHNNHSVGWLCTHPFFSLSILLFCSCYPLIQVWNQTWLVHFRERKIYTIYSHLMIPKSVTSFGLIIIDSWLTDPSVHPLIRFHSSAWIMYWILSYHQLNPFRQTADHLFRLIISSCLNEERYFFCSICSCHLNIHDMNLDLLTIIDILNIINNFIIISFNQFSPVCSSG